MKMAVAGLGLANKAYKREMKEYMIHEEIFFSY